MVTGDERGEGLVGDGQLLHGACLDQLGGETEAEQPSAVPGTRPIAPPGPLSLRPQSFLLFRQPKMPPPRSLPGSVRPAPPGSQLLLPLSAAAGSHRGREAAERVVLAAEHHGACWELLRAAPGDVLARVEGKALCRDRGHRVGEGDGALVHLRERPQPSVCCAHARRGASAHAEAVLLRPSSKHRQPGSHLGAGWSWGLPGLRVSAGSDQAPRPHRAQPSRVCQALFSCSGLAPRAGQRGVRGTGGPCGASQAALVTAGASENPTPPHCPHLLVEIHHEWVLVGRVRSRVQHSWRRAGQGVGAGLIYGDGLRQGRRLRLGEGRRRVALILGQKGLQRSLAPCPLAPGGGAEKHTRRDPGPGAGSPKDWGTRARRVHSVPLSRGRALAPRPSPLPPHPGERAAVSAPGRGKERAAQRRPVPGSHTSPRPDPAEPAGQAGTVGPYLRRRCSGLLQGPPENRRWEKGAEGGRLFTASSHGRIGDVGRRRGAPDLGLRTGQDTSAATPAGKGTGKGKGTEKGSCPAAPPLPKGEPRAPHPATRPREGRRGRGPTRGAAPSTPGPRRTRGPGPARRRPPATCREQKHNKGRTKAGARRPRGGAAVPRPDPAQPPRPVPAGRAAPLFAAGPPTARAGPGRHGWPRAAPRPLLGGAGRGPFKTRRRRRRGPAAPGGGGGRGLAGAT